MGKPLHDPVQLPFETFHGICLYLPSNQVCRARRVSRAWNQIFTHAIVTQWRRQDVSNYASLTSNKMANKMKQIMALRNGSPFFTHIIEGDIPHMAYACGVLVCIKRDCINAVVKRLHSNNEDNEEIILPDHDHPQRSAISKSMIVITSRSNKRYMWKLDLDKSLIQPALRIQHRSRRIDYLLVSADTLAIISMSGWDSFKVTTFSLVSGNTKNFTLSTVENRFETRLMLDYSGQHIFFFQKVPIDEEGVDFICTCCDLEGKITAEDSYYCPSDSFSFVYSTCETIMRPESSTIWTYIKRQSEDPKKDNTSWIWNRICYDSFTSKLEVKSQVINGLCTTRDGITGLFYWKDLAYCRGYNFESPEGECSSDRKQCDMNIINLETSLCRKARIRPLTEFARHEYLKWCSLRGDETFIVEHFPRSIVIYSFAVRPLGKPELVQEMENDDMD